MIELKNITKKFRQKGKEVTALDVVSLNVGRGKIFGVIGTSGAGKSTLIRTINLLEKPTSGEVIVDGRSLLQLSNSELAQQRRQIGMIFQHFNLLSSRTVFGNIALPLELAGASKDSIKERVKQLLELVGLEDKINDYPASLSGGQKQRVAIARTLANNPKVLLCDEATSALDPATTRSILNLLKDINKRLGITILLITHQMEVIKAICDEVAIISNGRLIEQGTVAELFTNAANDLTRDFITSSLHIEIPEIYRQRLVQVHEQGLYPLLQLELTGKSVDEPLLTQAAKQFGINANIITAQTSYAGNTSFGILIIELSGEEQQQQDAIKFFNNKHVKTKLLGYV